MHYLNKLRVRVILEESLCALLVLEYLISCLPMTVWFFVELLFMSVWRLNYLSTSMNKLRVRPLIEEKQAFFFSSNTQSRTQDSFSTFLGVPTTQRYEHYLGLPSLVS